MRLRPSAGRTPHPLPFSSLFPGGPVLEAPGARSCQKGTAVKPAVPAGGAPSTAGRGRRGLSHRVSPDPAHRPAEISTVTGGAAEVGDGICTHQPYPTPGGPPAPPTTRSPTRTLCVLFCRHHVLIFQHTAFYDIAVTSSVRDAWNAITTQSSTLGVLVRHKKRVL